MTQCHFSTRGGAQVKIAARSTLSTVAATSRSPSSCVCEGNFQRECDQTFGCRTKSPMVSPGGTRFWAHHPRIGMRIKGFRVVASGRIEPSTSGFSVQGRAAGVARKPKTGKGLPAARPNRPPRPNRFRAQPTGLRTEQASRGMLVKKLRWGGPSGHRTAGEFLEQVAWLPRHSLSEPSATPPPRSSGGI